MWAIDTKKQNIINTTTAHKEHILKLVCLCTKGKACTCNLLTHAGRRSEKREQCKQSKMKMLLRVVTYPTPAVPPSPRSCPPGHQGWWWYSNRVRCLPTWVFQFEDLHLLSQREGPGPKLCPLKKNTKQWGGGQPFWVSVLLYFFTRMVFDEMFALFKTNNETVIKASIPKGWELERPQKLV